MLRALTRLSEECVSSSFVSFDSFQTVDLNEILSQSSVLSLTERPLLGCSITLMFISRSSLFLPSIPSCVPFKAFTGQTLPKHLHLYTCLFVSENGQEI